MELSNPRRILLVGASDAPILDLLQDLTGSRPSPAPDDENSLAGTSHALPLKTPYYTATIPIWIDVPTVPPPAADDDNRNNENKTMDPAVSPATIGSAPSVAASAASYDAWTTSFLSTSIPGASDVLTALGAFVVCFRKPSSKEGLEDAKALLAAVARVVEGCKRVSEKEGCGEWDGVCLAIGLRRAVVPGLDVTAEEWEDICMDFGFEFVDGEVKGGARDEFGELKGIARLKEALEANDWAANDDEFGLDEFGLDEFGLDDFGDLEDEESMGFGIEAAELEIEMFGMKRAINEVGSEDRQRTAEKEVSNGEDEDEEDEVEKLEALMLRMQAVRDISSDLPDAERKRFAARAVKDIMKTI